MQKYGLVGKSLNHSFSKTFFEQKFEKENINAVYDNYELSSINEIKSLFKPSNKIIGFNVTNPYKEKVIPYLDELDDTAEKIQAVNVIKNENGKYIGFNTDLIGFLKSFFPFVESHHDQALILGTGGAAKAVHHALLSMDITTSFVSRTPENHQIGYDDIDEELMQSHQLIINCTPLGMHPKIEKYPKIPFQFLNENHLLYDLIYNPTITQFLALGNKHGAKILNGQKMLEIQAVESWKIWLK
ncbi:MAG: shikimate dehydrogenase [Psychroflexus sp.]|nr:shikimate dehydrogenase [Psychroflexus sp.]MDR9449318.1 shikimate dehydrogenase [Psychroflexus sp.]